MEDEFGGGGGRDERGARRGGRDEHGGHGGRGGRRERLFESGDLKVLILHLLAQQEPRHGYEIIKAIGQLAGDDYSPSPGAIYPTLTFLEETGSIAIVDPQDARKRYVITDEGRKELAAQASAADRTLKRLQMHQLRSREQRPAELVRATENLRTSLRLKLGDAGANADRELLEKIAAILDRAAVDIGRL
ncbi:PadR family transcriptional regulator [Diaphorobacter sp. HDW4A]|nr:PadR family transcriptional regulator [Diaphorobacter sp. HDW4A]